MPVRKLPQALGYAAKASQLTRFDWVAMLGFVLGQPCVIIRYNTDVSIQEQCQQYYEAALIDFSFTQAIAMNRRMSMSNGTMMWLSSGSILSDFKAVADLAVTRSVGYKD